MQTHTDEISPIASDSHNLRHGNSSHAQHSQLLQLRYLVLPIGKSFFHIQEANSGKVMGFRCAHNEACKLARDLEQASD